MNIFYIVRAIFILLKIPHYSLMHLPVNTAIHSSAHLASMVRSVHLPVNTAIHSSGDLASIFSVHLPVNTST